MIVRRCVRPDGARMSRDRMYLSIGVDGNCMRLRRWGSVTSERSDARRVQIRLRAGSSIPVANGPGVSVPWTQIREPSTLPR